MTRFSSKKGTKQTELLLALVILALIYLFAIMSQLRKSVKALQQRLAAQKHDKTLDPLANKAVDVAPEPDLDLDSVELTSDEISPSKPVLDAWQSAPAESSVSSATSHPAASRLADHFDRALIWLKRYFTEDNVIVRVGLIVLFCGGCIAVSGGCQIIFI